MSDNSSDLPCLASNASRRFKGSISSTRPSEPLCLKVSKHFTKSERFTPSLDWMRLSTAACGGKHGGRGQGQKATQNHSSFTSDWPILELRAVVKILAATVSLVQAFLHRATTPDDPSPMISCTTNRDLLPAKTSPILTAGRRT